MTVPPYDAIVLAGGRAQRFGADKVAATLGGRRLLDRVLDAVADAERIVVVGPPRPLPPGVLLTRENPPGGGPVAGLTAGLPLVTHPRVVVVAADLPFLTRQLVARLVAAVGPGVSGAVLADDAGVDQVLVGAWSTADLRDRLEDGESPRDMAMRRFLAPLRVRRIRSMGTAPAWWDIDTADDLRRAEGHVNTMEEWLGRVSAELGVDLPDRDLVLDLTRDVAHDVARPAAPLTAYLAGLAAGRAGGDLAAQQDAVKRVQALVAAWGGRTRGGEPAES